MIHIQDKERIEFTHLFTTEINEYKRSVKINYITKRFHQNKH